MVERPSRSTLVETLTRRYGGQNGAAPAAWAEAGHAERVLRRAPTPAGDEETAVSRPPGVSRALQYWEERPEPQPSHIDVERLTDQVIRSIDQRVIAARERFGRR